MIEQKQWQIGDEYTYKFDNRNYRYKIIAFVDSPFAGRRVHSVRWIEARKTWAKRITSHALENI